mmetsp:Transcript_6696/g.12141  ORF Transcript_6696/g.12141 Transcript_6696/m.12141 type:complete len:286 (-) Transcript_6696:68-925(-)
MAQFDFDELDVAEAQSEPLLSISVSQVAPSTTARKIEAVTGHEVAESSAPYLFSDAGSAELVPLEEEQSMPGTAIRSRGKKSLSRARAWFEIRRYFDAEPQQHYGKYDADEWKTYYAKELLLKTTCERLQQDGFVVIDAKLAPENFKRLVGQLCLDAPEQAAALENHMDGTQKALKAAASNEALMPLGDQGGHLVESEQDRALCESCLLSLGHDRQGSSALRPRSKQQFLQLFKSVLHEVAANSMDKDIENVPDCVKYSVQFAFGNMPSPKAPLMAPPQSLAIDA